MNDMRGSQFATLAVSVLFLAFPPSSVNLTGPQGIAWTIEVVDRQFGTGGYNSIALAPDGWPGISYSAGQELRYAWRDAGGWHNVTVDSSATDRVYSTSLVIDRNGAPHIGYMVWSSAGQQIWYAYWNTTLLSWVKELAADAGQGLTRTRLSFALDSQGIPHIAYIHTETKVLMFASRAGSWTAETVASVGGNGVTVSLKLDSGDTPHIAAYNYTLPGLEYYWKSGATWSKETVKVGAAIGDNGISLALNSGDRPRIAYVVVLPEPQMWFANRTATSWSITSIPTTPEAQTAVSLAIDSSDRPRIAYTAIPHLMYAHREGMIWRTVVVDDDSVWVYASLAYDSSNVAHIAYLGTAVSNLKYAKGATFNDLPTSSVQAITPYWWRAGPLAMQAAASDPDGTVARVDLYYRFDGGAGWGPWALSGSDLSPPWSWSFPFPDGEGRYEFYSLAFDGTDWETNKSAAETEAGYDATPPVSSALPILPCWHEAPVVINATASDALSGVADVTLEYAFSPDNFTWGPWTTFGTLTALPWSWTFSFPNGEGNYKFHTIASDVAGNVEASKDFAEAIAGYRMPPDYSPANPTPLSPATVGLSESVQLTLSVQNLGGSANKTSSLAFYNASTPLSPFSVLTVPPVAKSGIVGPFEVNWSSPASPCTCAVTAHIDYYNDIAESNETNNTYTWTLNVVPGPITKPDYMPAEPNPSTTVKVGLSSPLSLSVKVFNRGNATAIANATVAFHEQSSPPFSTFTLEPLAPATTSSWFTATWTSPAIPGTYLVSADVDYCANVTEWDETNNVYTWTIEVVAGPITSLVIGSPNYTSTVTYVKSSTPLSLSVLDQSGMGINRTRYSIDGGGWTDYVSPFFLAGEGQYVVEWYSEDLAGNVEAFNSRTLRVDDTPPATTLSIGNPRYLVGGNFVTSSTPLSLQSVDGGTLPVGVRVSRYRIGGGGWEDYSSSFTLAGEGIHTIDYCSEDLLTNQETVKSIQVIVDESPPATTISPATGEFNLTTTFALTATDGGSGVKVTRYRIDGGISTDYSVGFILPEGDHNISYYSVDNLNNTEQEKRLAVNVHAPPPPNTPPTVTITSPVGGEEFLKGSSHAITWAMHDDQDADDNLTVYVNYTSGGTTVSIVATVRGIELFLWTLPDMEASDVVVNITVIDTGGLKGRDQSGPITIKAPPPPPEVVANYKPFVAVVFTVILAVVGLWSSKKRPWKGGTGRKAVMKGFTFTSIPFVLAESATGILSLSFEPLRIPPVVGWGTGVDVLILVAGVLFSLLRLARKGVGRVEPQGANAQ